MKKVLAIYGGPRRDKNTEKLLNKFLEGVDREKIEIEKVILKELVIQPCISCYNCNKTGECSIKDDMTMLYDKLNNSDIIILASPIYFGSVSALTKAMIDRCQAFWSAKYLAGIRKNNAKKKGYFIASAGSTDVEAFKCASYTVKLFFAACGAAYTEDILVNDTDRIPVEKNDEALNKAIELGRCISF